MEKNGTTKKSGAAVSRQRNKKRMKELKSAFDSATSAEEMGDALINMQESGLFNEKGLGFETWKLAQISIDGNYSFARSSQRNVNKARQAFYSAKSVDEMLKAFQIMESLSEEKDLGFDCWRLTQKLYEENGDPGKTLCYGKRALSYALDRNNADSNQATLIMITNTLPMLGYACLKLKRFDESLIYLNWSHRNLSKLELDNSFPPIVFSSLGATHFNLAIVKTALGRGEEAFVHVQKMLEIQEKAKAEDSIDQAIDDVVEEMEGLGLSEQEEVDGAVRLLKEMKESATGGDSSEKNRTVAFKMEG